MILSIGYSQKEELKKNNPCSDPLIKLAKSSGVKSIPIKDILRYRKVIKECEDSGNSAAVEQIYLMDWERDYKRSKNMASWTSTHAMFVIVTFTYYYIAKILDIPFDVKFFPKDK